MYRIYLLSLSDDYRIFHNPLAPLLVYDPPDFLRLHLREIDHTFVADRTESPFFLR